MEKNPQAPQNQQSSSGGCIPTITFLVGLGMLGVGLLAVLNTAFGWDLVLEVYGSDLEIPKYWDATIGVLVVGAIITLIGWAIGTAPFLRFYRKNKLLVILGSIGILVGTFFLLNEYDKSIRRENEAYFAKMDSLRAANPDSFAQAEMDKEPAYNPYADRKIQFVITNPSVDTMEVYLDGSAWLTIKPMEFKDGEMTPGMHHVAAEVGGDTLATYDLDVAERTESSLDEIMVLNVDSFFNIGVLNFQDFYGDDNQKRKGAKTLNYRLESLHWHEPRFSINVNKGRVTLPRRKSLDVSYGTALKLVIMPDAYADDKDKAFDYAIWKFIDEEKKGYQQDGLDFYMLKGEKRKKAIANRLKEDLKRFKKEEGE